MYECRCDWRLKGKDEGSTRFTYTGFRGELEHLKIKTRLIDERFVSSDTAQDRTCTGRVVVRSGHRTTTRDVKKNWKKKLSLFVPLWPLSSALLPPDQNYLFFKKDSLFFQKKSKVCKTISWEVRSRTTVTHTRWVENLPVLRIEILLETGWTTVNHHPIVNIIMGVRSLCTLRASIDTMGEEQTMDFIAALITVFKLQNFADVTRTRVPTRTYACLDQDILQTLSWHSSNPVLSDFIVALITVSENDSDYIYE